MAISYKQWSKAFLACFGIFIGTAFCMKWMEPDFISQGKLFTIIGLEISYPQEKMIAVLSGLSDPVRGILKYHLTFDFAFMAGVYPGIAALCMMARLKSHREFWKKLFLVIAFLQFLAWGCDIYENTCLFNWIRNPEVGDLGTYHLVVMTKWVIALLGVLLAIPFTIRRQIV